MWELEKYLKEPTAQVNNRIQESSEKLEIEIKGFTENQLPDEIQMSAERPKEVPNPYHINAWLRY